nr:hypothetical protein [Tanacetum cinerariifolium]
MKIMSALVLFLVVITSASSVLSVSLNNNNDENQDIVMVVDDATSMHDAGKAQNGKFFLEDGKVLTLARKLSPFGFTCVDNYVDRCGGFYRCCGDLICTNVVYGGTCVNDPSCLALGSRCGGFNYCCGPHTCSDMRADVGVCV